MQLENTIDAKFKKSKYLPHTVDLYSVQFSPNVGGADELGSAGTQLKLMLRLDYPSIGRDEYLG